MGRYGRLASRLIHPNPQPCPARTRGTVSGDLLDDLAIRDMRPAGDPLPGAGIGLLGRASEGAYGDAGIRQYQTGLVVDQPAGEGEGRRGVVVALVPVLVGGPGVLLLEAFHAQIQSSYVGGRRLRRRTGDE